MAWQERVKEAAYTSPSGIRLVFLYENVSQAISRNGTAFNFPDADGTYVQLLGNTGRRYPMRLFFSGSNHDLEAEAFMLALLEPGTGVLDHPFYGTLDVVPFGDITRRDDLKTAANQTIIEATFWETIPLIYPTDQKEPGATVAEAVAAFNAAQAAEFADSVDVAGALDQSTLKAKYKALLDTTESGLRAVADAQADVQKQFDTVVDSINRGIDVLVSAPLDLAFQTSIMIQAPARALTAIEDRLSAYSNLAASIFTPTDGSTPPLTVNEARTRDLYALSYVSGPAVAAVNSDFETRGQALTTAETLIAQLAAATLWREAVFAATQAVAPSLDAAAGVIDTGAAYQALQDAVAAAVGYLISVSFTLKFERRIVLDRARTMVDLVAELYGEVDNRLDFFMASNNLSGSEILELPRGREIVYYV